MGFRLPARAGAALLGGLAVVALIIGLTSSAEATKSPAIGKMKAQAVSKAVKDGRIKLGRNGLIDLAKADEQWARNSRVRAGAGAPIRKGKLAAKT